MPSKRCRLALCAAAMDAKEWFLARRLLGLVLGEPVVPCIWCGGDCEVSEKGTKGRGYCSARCRQKAWYWVQATKEPSTSELKTIEVE